MPVIENAFLREKGNVKRSLEYLGYHSRVLSLLLNCLLLKFKGNTEEAMAKWEALKKMLKINELRYHEILDVSQFIFRMDGFVKAEVKNEIVNN